MILSLITAADEDNVIGLGNTLPWNLPADLRYFQKITKGHPVIMGRKTYDSIYEKLSGPLPDRYNIVITRHGSLYADDDIAQVSSLEDGIQLAKRSVDDPSFLTDLDEEKTPEQGEAFVIGGQQVYELAMPFADRIYLTRIHNSFEGDKFFPPMPKHEWKIMSEDRHKADTDNTNAYTFFVYERQK